MSATLIAVGFATMVLAGVVRGLTGFGLALIAVPILSIVVSPKIVVPVVVLQTFLTNIPLVVGAWADVEFRHIWPLMLSAVVGLPFGAYLLLWLDADALRVFIGGVVTVFAVLLALGVSYRVRRERERLAFLPIGFASGLLNGSSSLSGPPVILFFANQGVPPRTFRANILAFFFVTSFVAVGVFAVSGLFTRDVFMLAAVLLPALLVATLLGARFAHRVRAGVFRAITLGVVALAGMSAIASGLGIL